MRLPYLSALPGTTAGKLVSAGVFGRLPASPGISLRRIFLEVLDTGGFLFSHDIAYLTHAY